MKLTPDDISARVFSGRIVGGYNPKEVTAFLEKVATQFDEILQENQDLKARVKEKDLQIMGYKEREDLLREAITTAQQTAKKMQEQAEQTAKETVEEAHKKANLITQDARDSLQTVYQDLSNLRRVHIQLKNTMKAVLQSHQDLLEQDPVHTLLPGMGLNEEEIEDKVTQTLNELSRAKDLL